MMMMKTVVRVLEKKSLFHVNDQRTCNVNLTESLQFTGKYHYNFDWLIQMYCTIRITINIELQHMLTVAFY